MIQEGHRLVYQPTPLAQSLPPSRGETGLSVHHRTPQSRGGRDKDGELVNNPHHQAWTALMGTVGRQGIARRLDKLIVLPTGGRFFVLRRRRLLAPINEHFLMATVPPEPNPLAEAVVLLPGLSRRRR